MNIYKDYRFLWDLVCLENPNNKHLKNGINLFIFELSDDYKKVELLCPHIDDKNNIYKQLSNNIIAVKKRKYI